MDMYMGVGNHGLCHVTICCSMPRKNCMAQMMIEYAVHDVWVVHICLMLHLSLTL